MPLKSLHHSIVLHSLWPGTLFALWGSWEHNISLQTLIWIGVRDQKDTRFHASTNKQSQPELLSFSQWCLTIVGGAQPSSRKVALPGTEIVLTAKMFGPCSMWRTTPLCKTFLVMDRNVIWNIVIWLGVLDKTNFIMHSSTRHYGLLV